MSTTEVKRDIPPKTKLMLAVLAGGRCELCNEFLFEHHLTKKRGVFGQDAHIRAFSKRGPRGREPGGIADVHAIENLMLLCHRCHKLIDDHPNEHTVEQLRAKKTQHESRVRLVTGTPPHKVTRLLLYGANVGDHASPLTVMDALGAVLPGRYPADREGLVLGMTNSASVDRDEAFWVGEERQLRRKFTEVVQPHLRNGERPHFSVFGFAPQPLLTLLGFLLSDIPEADVYQLHREPVGWAWPDGGEVDPVQLQVDEPSKNGDCPALVLSLSATVADHRVTDVLGHDAAIWRVSVPDPHNDILRTQADLKQFRKTARRLLNRIKARHPGASVIHVFPATPVSVAIELGRILMPKADLPLQLYDENRRLGGFQPALHIGERRPD